MTRIFRTIAATCLALASLPAWATADNACLVMEKGWIRLPPAAAAMPMAAGFGTLRNGCATPVVMQSLSSPAFADVTLHETMVHDGMSHMRALPQLQLAPGQAATLAPGGMHLMLMQPGTPLQAGQHLPVVLHLADGRQVRVELEVRSAAP